MSSLFFGQPDYVLVSPLCEEYDGWETADKKHIWYIKDERMVKFTKKKRYNVDKDMIPFSWYQYVMSSQY